MLIQGCGWTNATCLDLRPGLDDGTVGGGGGGGDRFSSTGTGSPTLPADDTRGAATATPDPKGSASSSGSGGAGVVVLVVFLVLLCVIVTAAAALWLASKDKGKARARAISLATGSKAGDEMRGVQMVPMASNPLHRGAGSVRTGISDSAAVRGGESYGFGAAMYSGDAHGNGHTPATCMYGDDSYGSGHYGLFGGDRYGSGSVTTVRRAATSEGGNQCVSIQQRQGTTPDTIYAVPLADPADGSHGRCHGYGPMPTLRRDAVTPAGAVAADDAYYSLGGGAALPDTYYSLEGGTALSSV